jgi:hypothetical protein
MDNRPPTRASPTGVRRLASFATRRFKESISRQQDAHQEELNRRVEHVFLQRVNNLMVHFIMVMPRASLRFHCTNLRN